MKLQVFILALQFCSGIYATLETLTPHNATPLRNFAEVGSSNLISENLFDSSSSCGGKLVARDGTISYKNFSPYSPNERCVWTIRAPNATSYNVEADTLGASEIVMITGLGIGGLISHNVPTRATNVSMANSNVLVITFSTVSTANTQKYRGFSLRYTSSISETNPKASSTSEDIIVRANVGHIKYPPGEGLYGNQDLSVIIINPIFSSEPVAKQTEVIYIKAGLEGQSCQDLVTVYVFDRALSSANRWKPLGRMCGGLDSEFITSQDVVMIIFESDYSTTSTGFHLYSRYV